MLQEKQRVTSLEGESGERCSQSSGSGQGEVWGVSLRHSKDSEFSLHYRSRVEKAMAPHSSTLAWKIPWTEEPGGLKSMGSLRVGHN